MSYVPEKWRPWTDKWLQVHPDRGGDSVNGVQFAAEAIVLSKLSNQVKEMELVGWFRNIHRSVALWNGKHFTTKQTPTTTFEKDKGSHDNETLLCCASYVLGETFHRRIKILGRHWHPRDIIFYGVMRGFTLARLFLWILIPIHMFTCLRAFKSFGSPETSTKILAYFRMITLYETHWEMRLCFKICSWIIKKNKKLYSNTYGREVDLDTWHKNIQYYFKYQTVHPVVDANKIFEERYSGFM